MKIIRLIGEDDKVYYGVTESLEDKAARIIEGSVFENFSVTGREIVIKKLLFPVTAPNIIGIGLNYRKHADETGIKYPDIPVMFLKGTNSLIGPGEPILLPQVGTNEVDYEAELAVVIGKRAKNISKEKASEYISGYCCANDVSARDWQITLQKKQWARGKSFDTFCPLGPWIVTRDEIPNPQSLRIRTLIDGDIYQESSTSDMIFDVFTLVSDLSRSMTLLPGTVILTGTPGGVGFTRKPPVFLKEGNVVTIEIEGIGCLTNPVIREKMNSEG